MKPWWIAVVAVVACSKVPAPTSPSARPDDVLVVLRLPSYDATVTAIGSYARAIGADGEAYLKENLAELDQELGLASLDHTRPIHVVFVAPARGVDEPDTVLVAAVRDEAGLRKGLPATQRVKTSRGWAAIGPPAALDRVSAWALGTLAVEPAPAKASASVYPAAIARRWGEELRAQLTAPDSPVMDTARDAVLGLLSQSERLDVQADVAADLVTVEIVLVARPGTTLALLLAAQHPSKFAMLEHLPLDGANGTIGGNLTLGPLSGPVRGLTTALIATELGPYAEPVRVLFEALWTSGTGEIAAASQATETLVDAFGVTDAAAARVNIQALTAKLSERRADDGTRIRFEAAPPEDGVPIETARPEGDGVPPDFVLAWWAAWDNTFAFSFGPDGDKQLRAAITRSRATPAVPAAIAAVIAKARQRGDSLIESVDVSGGLLPPIASGFGVRAGEGHLWIDLPAAQVARMRAASPDDEE